MEKDSMILHEVDNDNKNPSFNQTFKMEPKDEYFRISTQDEAGKTMYLTTIGGTSNNEVVLTSEIGMFLVLINLKIW